MDTRNPTALVWLITGGSSGLGLALVKQVLSRGDYVIAPVREPSKMLSHFNINSNAGIGVCNDSLPSDHLHVFKLDLGDSYDEIQKKVDESVTVWGRVDVLVNNAATVMLGTLEEAGCQGMRDIFDINFFGVINLTNAVLPHMRARRAGTIVIVGSRSAFRNQLYGVGLYAASKAALHSYGETLSAELKPFNIHVLVVVPGSFSTPGFANVSASFSLVVNNPSGPIPDYASAHQIMKEVLYAESVPTFSGNGDPQKGMHVLVDVVKHEGQAGEVAGTSDSTKDSRESGSKRELPLWLFLGEDSVRDVRARLKHVDGVLNVWEAVGSSVGIDA